MTDDYDAEARAVAHGLIQGHLRRKRKVRSMSELCAALVKAFSCAKEGGRENGLENDEQG